MKLIFSTLLSCLSLLNVVFAQGNWDLVKEKNGIKIYNRKIEGSKLKEFKGSVQFKAKVEDVLKVLTDYKKQDLFIYKAKKGSIELLKTEGANNLYTYMVIETPWPASNRDVVTLYHIEPIAKNGSVTIKVSAVNDLKPEVKGIVRVDKMKGFWKITPLGNGWVEVEHQAYSSPGGNVPDALANSASVDAPYSMLENLRKLF
ncbi:MAG: START domain-containing protein [Chitinophagales bacterium]|nr:START domain-containing protein [Chitinophagales bacterium]